MESVENLEVNTGKGGEIDESLVLLQSLATGQKKTEALDAADKIIFAGLPALFGLKPEELPIKPEQFEKLFYSLRAMAAIDNVGAEPVASIASQLMDTDEACRVVIHNRAVAEKLQGDYDLASFDALFDLAKSKGVFSLKISEQNGLVTTAEAAENWDMSGRQWVTDTVRCGDIVREANPLAWTKALLTLCDFYNQDEEMAAMHASINDPAYYRQGGLLNGVAHIFIPQTLKRDASWFNNKRLESHGLALKALCDTLTASLDGETGAGDVGFGIAGGGGAVDWAFSDAQIKEHGQKIAETVVCLASYLKSINTDQNGRFDFGAPSAGAWEEIPFPEGLTWDTEAIRSGFESLRNLLFSATRCAPLSEIISHIRGHRYADWLQQPQTLDYLIKQARGKVIDRLFGQMLPVESPHRPLDCSLAFISTSTVVLGSDVISDVVLQYQLLQVLETNLVRAHGIVRYAPFDLTMEDGRKEPVFDSYLADNYWLVPSLRAALSRAASNRSNEETADEKHYGSSDCSTSEEYLARVKLARAGSEAQWCFVSVIAEGYARQVLKLQKLLDSQIALQGKAAVGSQDLVDGLDTTEIEKLIVYGLNKAGEFLSRSYARITSEGAVKANGHDCPAWAIPEAYEFVSPLGGQSKTHIGALPGANTPLAWGQASLYRASVLFRRCLS
ncbi:MAG: hypothetical protein KGS72_10940 [Cyanobacteria bacterium REEB67]|nr:hypothetical protein [Cyanobacteria bacterium REEB67]